VKRATASIYRKASKLLLDSSYDEFDFRYRAARIEASPNESPIRGVKKRFPRALSHNTERVFSWNNSKM
jgi:hypothetical protein